MYIVCVDIYTYRYIERERGTESGSYTRGIHNSQIRSKFAAQKDEMEAKAAIPKPKRNFQIASVDRSCAFNGLQLADQFLPAYGLLLP